MHIRLTTLFHKIMCILNAQNGQSAKFCTVNKHNLKVCCTKYACTHTGEWLESLYTHIIYIVQVYNPLR